MFLSTTSILESRPAGKLPGAAAACNQHGWQAEGQCMAIATTQLWRTASKQLLSPLADQEAITATSTSRLRPTCFCLHSAQTHSSSHEDCQHPIATASCTYNPTCFCRGAVQAHADHTRPIESQPPSRPTCFCRNAASRSRAASAPSLLKPYRLITALQAGDAQTQRQY